MGLIREPLNVDFFVGPGMLSADEKALISAYIKECKTKQKDQKVPTRRKKDKATLHRAL